ncbi:radical SAM protein [candidate division KSB1 bacterium]|nr:radical SAM protein [candidate division KSB1 bacterium]
MNGISINSALNIAGRGIRNIFGKKPLAISFEIIHSCNANCAHCDKEGFIEDEELAPPEKFVQIYDDLKPIFAQISGGEPLLREDVVDIVKKFRSRGKVLPVIVFVSNAALLTFEKYKELHAAGVNQYSFSLDMPDERHDENRQIPGLFSHLSELVPKITAEGNKNVTMICAIRKENLPYLSEIADTAISKWNANMIFSSYTQLRTGDAVHSPQSPEELNLLEQQIDRLIEMKRQGAPIVNSESMFRGMIRFFKTNDIPNCRTGYRHLVVNPDGSLVPCAMHQVRFQTQKDLIENFTKTNDCGACYVPLRANTEKTLKQYWQDMVVAYAKQQFSRA